MTLRCGWGRVDGTGLTVTLLARQAGLCLRGEADLLSLDTLREAIAVLGPDCRQIPAPSGSRTGDSATASIQAACRQRNEGDARAEDQPIQPAASR
jgi:hypothetical protein